MPAIEVGRVCVKLAGRDAGSKCVVANVLDENFVEVISAGRKKKRRVSIRHLEPLAQKIEIKSEEEARAALAQI
ncbi:MAG: 50S ribosomal protein L14e [Candidatus Micrarchaeota archaeon]